MPGFTHTCSGSYLAFVLTTWVKASEYSGIIYSGTVCLALQFGIVFESASNTYMIVEQVWTACGNKIYCNLSSASNIRPNVETLMTLAYRYDNGYVATGILQECTSPVTLINVHFPTSYRYGCETFNVINTYGFTDPSGVNPSFALEGTITSVCTILFCCHDSTGWDAMWVNVAQVPINAVAGHSSAIGVGGTAPIPTFYAESGLTLFHNEFLGVWWNPYAWYFSIGFAVAYSSRNLHYVQLSECQSKNTINGLNYCTHWIQP